MDKSTFQVTKLAAKPTAEAMKDCGVMGHHITELRYKTTEKMKAKGVEALPTSWWIVPDVEVMLPLAVDDGFEKPLAMVYDLIETAREERLRELDGGDLSAKQYCLDIEALATRYFTNGRSLGVKQDQIEAWIGDVLAPAMDARILRNSPGMDATKRAGLVASVANSFEIAATRGNSRKEKGSNVYAPRPVLKDLLQRLETYRKDGDLVECEELTALHARISGHLAALPPEEKGVDESF